ncbi:MAG: hypothetical protein AAGA37_15705 [Actinomycetota bacterium]
MRRRSQIIAVLVLILTGTTATMITTSSAQPTSPSISIVEARVTGDGPWTSWLGASAERTLVLTLRNDGGEPVDAPITQLRVGKDTTGNAIPVPPLPPIPPESLATYRITFSLDAFSFGTHAISGAIRAGDADETFRAETTHIPWLLLILPALVLAQVILVSLRNRTRRYLHRGRQPVDTTLEEIEPQATAIKAVPTQDDEPPTSSEPPEPADATADDPIQTIVGDELDRALNDLGTEALTEATFRAAIEHHARAATDRISERLELSRPAQAQLASHITRALLERGTDHMTPTGRNN